MRELYLSGSGRFVSERFNGMDGFFIAEPFDEFVRRLSPGYLREAWDALTSCLRFHGVDPARLSWGHGHPAYTHGAVPLDDVSPLGCAGWVMPADRRSGSSLWSSVDPFFLTVTGQRIEDCLRRSPVPITVAGGDIRSFAVRRVVGGVDLAPVAPADVELGLAILVDHCADPGPEWSLTGEWAAGDHPGGRIARAIATRARDSLREDMPGVERRGDLTIALDGGLTITFGADACNRPGWARVWMSKGDTSGRHEPVSLERVFEFHRGLQRLGREDTAAELLTLVRAAQIVADRRHVRGYFTAHADSSSVDFAVRVRPEQLSSIDDVLRAVLSRSGAGFGEQGGASPA